MLDCDEELFLSGDYVNKDINSNQFQGISNKLVQKKNGGQSV